MICLLLIADSAHNLVEGFEQDRGNGIWP